MNVNDRFVLFVVSKSFDESEPVMIDAWIIYERSENLLLAWPLVCLLES